MTSPTPMTLPEAQDAVDSAAMWLTQALETAHRRREQLRQPETELEAAREALLLADLVRQHMQGEWLAQ